jgi:hypothetical protein
MEMSSKNGHDRAHAQIGVSKPRTYVRDRPCGILAHTLPNIDFALSKHAPSSLSSSAAKRSRILL